MGVKRAYTVVRAVNEWGSGNGHFGGLCSLEHLKKKLAHADYVGDLTPPENLEFNPVKGGVSAHRPREVLAVRRLFLADRTDTQ